MDEREKGPQEARTRLKRWLILLFAAILVGFLGLIGHQNYLEALGLVIALLAIAMFIWSSVRFSMEVRPPTTRRRFRRIHMPHIRRRIHRGSYTEELHAAIFQDQTAK
jgi:Ca2+/Na+ antiporter